MSIPTLTPEQRRLARHALGLDNSRTVYRNRYVVAWQSAADDEWTGLCEAGLAVRTYRGGKGERTYALTLRGATLAMEQGETLPRDFALDMIEIEDRAKAGGGS